MTLIFSRRGNASRTALPSWRSRLILALFVPLAACTVTPNIQVPVENLPDAYVAAPERSEPVMGEWWRSFDDPLLNALVEQASSTNPAVLQAVARSRMAQAQAGISRAERFPQVSGGVTASRQRQNLSGLGAFSALAPAQGGEPASTAFITENYGLSVDVSWELDLWGRLSAQSQAAQADFLASRENLRAVRQSMAAQAARMYFSVIEARAQLALAERTAATVSEIARQINNRADAGIAAPSDRLLANANQASAQAGVIQRREALARLTRQLEILLRDYPSGRLQTVAELPPVPPPPPAGLPAELLTRRPDLRASELALRAADLRFTAARRALLPGISLTGSTGTASNELNNLLSGGSVVWSIAGRLLQPIFQAGRVRAQVDAVEGQRDEAIQAYADTALRAFAEVETALAVDAFLAEREAAFELAARDAEGAVDISFNRYREGIDPFLAVLESQQRALDSRSAYLAVRRARLENRIDLHLALGGGFSDPLPVAVKQD